MEKKRKLTLREAADYVRFAPKTLYNLTSQKAIPHFKVRGRLRFDQDELDRWQEDFRAA